MTIGTVYRISCRALADSGFNGGISAIVTDAAIDIFLSMLINYIGLQAKVSQVAAGAVCIR
jgi:hypothetical protein